MENYFQRFVENLEGAQTESFDRAQNIEADSSLSVGTKTERNIAARLAVYDSLTVAPRIIELNAGDYDEFINLLAAKTYQSSKEIGGNMPYTVIREIIENLIHAYFEEVVISILDDGNTVRISDQGPGIKNKDKAFEPGFSTASSPMKAFIKGVGSGLPIAKESLIFLGGAITVEDNLNKGTVITLSVPHGKDLKKKESDDSSTADVDLNKRQKQVLFLVMELGSVGPSKIASELGVSLSTAYRDLIYLEEKSLIFSDDQGKRVLTSLGIEYLDEILNS